MTSPQIVVAVDQSLAWCPASLDQDMLDAYKYTLMFAQAAARTVNSDPSTEAYYEAMTQQLMKLGWNVTESGKLNYDQQASRISPAQIVGGILNPYLSPDQQSQLGGLLAQIQQPDDSIKGFVDFWWRSAHTNASQASMALGPLVANQNAPEVSMIFYSFKYDASDVGSLFVQIDKAGLDVFAYSLKMNYNFALWPNVKAEILPRIQAKVDAHIDTQPLDL